MSHSMSVCKSCSLTALLLLLLCIQNGGSPLYAASQEGHTDVVDILLRKGADVNQTTTSEVCATINICVYQFLL